MKTLLLSTLIGTLTTNLLAAEVELVNNQPFPVAMPVYVRGLKASGPAGQAFGGAGAILADVPANASRKVSLDEAHVATPELLVLSPAADGIALTYRGAPRGALSWSAIVHPMDPNARKVDPPPSTKIDFAAAFHAFPLKFEKKATGPLFNEWTAESSASGLKISLDVRCFPGGYLDVDTTVTNESAPTKDVYAAVVCRWDQPAGVTRSLDYDNQLTPFDDGASTGFRAGTDRHLYVQRGVDWVTTRLPNNAGSVEWLNDFTASFTVHKPATAKQPARWVGANTAQLAQEAQAKDHALYSITEIARPNVKMYRSRLDDNVLPPPGEPLTISSRLMFDEKPIDDITADQRFIAYAGFNPQSVTENGNARVSFGADAVRFGTTYFPYSTLGENFIVERQPGMSTEAYWPLAPETVKHFDKFADDIRGDLRIAKSMGFDLIRLHHLELLWNKDAKTGADVIDAKSRQAYLDFFFGELKKLDQKALLDVKLPPADVADLVARYRPLIDGVEIDNEVLIFGMPDPDIQYWTDCYAAVKKVAPDMPVHWTAHTNTGAFNRLQQLGVPFDKVGQHAYMDAIEAIPSARDYALAAGNLAAKLGKEPIITEWNWRFLTRMTFDARAKVYPPIFENVLATRCMPTIYQFQFQDSLAMNPTTLKGMRRYELLLLSRRPKPEALELENLVDKYGSPRSPHRLLKVDRQVVELSDGKGTAAFELTNEGDKPLELTATAEAPEGMKADVGSAKVSIPPHGTVKVPLSLAVANPTPGFYHAFVRLEGSDDFVRYAWAEVRLAGTPKIDKAPSTGVTYGPGALDFNFNRPLTVVYPNDAAPLDVESAWTLFITLESATGRLVEIYQANDLPKDSGRTIIRVESKRESGPTVRADGDALLVTGPAPKDVATAAMDLTLRYWKYAKDSAIPRVGLTTERVEQKGNKTDLE